MKFVFVFDGLGYGGIEKVGIEYCNALLALGHEVCVINLNKNAQEFVSKLSSDVLYIEKSYPRNLAPERYASLIKRFSWGKFLYPLIFLGAKIVTAFIKPFLRHTIMGTDIAIAFSGHYNDLTFVGDDFIPCRKKIAWLHGSVSSYALISDGYLNLYKKFDGLVTLDDDGLNEFKFSNPYLNYNIEKIHNPVPVFSSNCDTSKTNELKSKYGKYILSVGRFEYPKDYVTLVNAIDILQTKYNLDYPCVLVGDGPDMESVKQAITSKSLEKKIFLEGYQSNPNPYYESCSIFVLSSISEGLPTVLLEAMSHGKPVISTNTPGAREILGYNEWGVLVRIGDPSDLATQIKRLMCDNSINSYYADKGKKRLEEFDPNKTVNHFLDFSNKLFLDEA